MINFKTSSIINGDVKVDELGDQHTKSIIEELKEYAPEYFELATFKGVEVYVWEMASDLIECTALPGTNRIKNDEEILNATKHWITLTEMKEILKYNGIPFDRVLVIPFENPLSSYKTEDEYALLKKANKLLEYDINEVNFNLEVLSLFTKDFFLASYDEYEYFTMVIKNSDWQEGTADCINNIKIVLDGETYFYHSDCGTINDNKNNKSLTLSKDQKEMIDSIIEKNFKIVSNELPIEE